MRLLSLLAAGLSVGLLVAAPVPKDAKKVKDDEAIVGTWKVEKCECEKWKVTPPTAEELAQVSLTFDKDGKLVVTNPGGIKSEYEYKLDPAAKPKAMDMTREGDVLKMVYELDGDTLKTCIAGDGPRPTELKADGEGVMLFTFKRVKDEKKDK